MTPDTAVAAVPLRICSSPYKVGRTNGFELGIGFSFSMVVLFAIRVV